MKTFTASEKVEMTKKALQSVSGYTYNVGKLESVCEDNAYIPDGAKIMENATTGEVVYFENGSFVTKVKDAVVRSFATDTMTDVQLLQLFAIWASKQPIRTDDGMNFNIK